MKPLCADDSGGPRWRLAVGLLLLAGLHGFAREDIKVYRVPKERLSTQPLPAGHPDLSVAGAVAEPKLSWKTPEGWNEVPPGEMRKASFNVKGKDGKQADVSVIPLPGAAGGDAANVNRWRGQVALAALPPDTLKQTALAVQVADQPGELYDLSGTNTSNGEPTRILAVIQHREGTAWFFKMTGEDQLVAQQKPAFIEFLKSFAFAAGGASPALPASHPPLEGNALPSGHPEISSTPPTVGEPPQEGQPKWQPPPGWKEVPGGQFLVAKFLVSGNGSAQAAVNVSRSAGDGGGLAGNVNRWRGQLGLAPLSAEELNKTVTPFKISDGEASLVEMAGTDARSGQPAKLVGAIVPQGGQTWFYKLMGNAKVVESAQDAFKQFVQTAKY
jgi:hypothetical protein